MFFFTLFVLKKDDSAAIRKILSKIASKQVEKLGSLTVPLQTLNPGRIPDDEDLFKPIESIQEKESKDASAATNTTSSSGTKKESKLEQTAELFSGINPWHTLLEKASSYERLSRLDPATKPWI